MTAGPRLPRLNILHRRLIAEAKAGRVRRTVSGYNVHDRPEFVKARIVNREVKDLVANRCLELHPDNLWRPTNLGLSLLTQH